MSIRHLYTAQDLHESKYGDLAQECQAQSELMMEDPETQEAVFNLLYAMKTLGGPPDKKRTEEEQRHLWECFTDRIKTVLRHSETRLEEIVNDPDFIVGEGEKN